MKRSEMLEHIAGALKVERAYPYMDDKKRADKLLRVIENHGMLPPPYYDYFYDDAPECDGMIPEWEPEDD